MGGLRAMSGRSKPDKPTPRYRTSGRNRRPATFVSNIGKYMDNTKVKVVTLNDQEVIAAAEKLSSRWIPNTSKRLVAGGQIHQRMGDGRSHLVAVETKRTGRRQRVSLPRT